MRNVGGLATIITQPTTYQVTCWKLTRRDGTVFGYTNHTRNLSIDGVTYVANSGFEPSAVMVNVGTEVDSSDVVGFIRPGSIDSASLRSGKFDGAQVEKFSVDSRDPEAGAVKLQWGLLGEVQARGVTFQAELRGATQYFGLEVVDLVQASCRYRFGDPVTCKARKRSASGTVATVTNNKTFTAAALVGVQLDGFFALGKVDFTSGDNDGLSFDVKSYVAASGTIVLQMAPLLGISVGDAFTVWEGCAKILAACQQKVIDATGAVNNVINYGGEPHVPGSDFLLKIIGQKS